MKMKFKKTELKGHSKSFHCKIELLNTHTFNLGILNGQGHDFGQFYCLQCFSIKCITIHQQRFECQS